MAKKKVEQEISIEEKLKVLYDLQDVMSEVDRIRILRGELPIEVQELEDEIAGLQTRQSKCEADIAEIKKIIADRKVRIKEAQTAIEKYTAQLDSVRNNREYESLTKEIEYQSLEIQFLEKKIGEDEGVIKHIKSVLEEIMEVVSERSKDLEEKKGLLDEIVSETKVEEEKLREKASKLETKLDERLSKAFKRIRKSARNGLAVSTVDRESCSGCFNKIPPQKQLEIKTRKKVVVCEYCGRILVDKNLGEEK
ncbi:zinc ribbon domain protein [Porphyromonas sp. COT-108 OH2963]|uniref:Zinc ribbon domain protein n=1 Tax=Porphyromonas canoris TaxID=36875 RepID=A0ABR4XKF4_9PORP|nr:MULTISPECIES: C4-type zinc ribbon domain-containing protein [Porphyromonas]KGN92133.1 zinc ribbon domain protein [Porphyromonas canoris]KGN96621.1 zinc ribbon domain protein [Porphyromonas sp. COT-108 OH2963]